MDQHTEQQNNKKIIWLSTIIIFMVLTTASIIYFWQNYKHTSSQNFLQAKINDLNNKITQLEVDKNNLLAQINDLQFPPAQQQKDEIRVIKDKSIIETEKKEWNLYKNEMYGYEIKYPTTLSLQSKTTLSNWDGTGISITNPIVETGYEAWDVVKTEKIKISDTDKYLTIKYFNPSTNLPEEDRKKYKPFILATWGEDNWENSGQIGFSYKNDSDPNLKLYNEILSTLKLID